MMKQSSISIIGVEGIYILATLRMRAFLSDPARGALHRVRVALLGQGLVQAYDARGSMFRDATMIDVATNDRITRAVRGAFAQWLYDDYARKCYAVTVRDVDAQGASFATQLAPETIAASHAARDSAVDYTAQARRITVAKKDYSSRGTCREHWFRMVWRDGDWQYIGDRMAAVGMRSSERHDSVTADVWPGELVLRHSRGAQVDDVSVARAVGVDTKGEALTPLRSCTFTTRGVILYITLPTGETIERPNPRSR